MMHISCTICTDVVEPEENIHATRCGHVFHNHCLSDWIERSNTCPQCRRVVTDNCMLRIYPTFSDEKEVSSLQARLHHTLKLYDDLQTTCVEKEEQLKKASDDLKKNEESLEIFMSELDSRNSAMEALKQRLESVETQNVEVQRLKEENAALKDNVRTLNGEIERQNILYGEFMAQISIQRDSLELHTKEAARLRQENDALKRNLRSLNGELKRHKLLSNEPRVKCMRNPVHNTKRSQDVDVSKNNEDRPKVTLDRAIQTSPNKTDPHMSQSAQSLDNACVTDKMKVLSHKLNLAKSSHSKQSKTLVNLIVAWVKLKVKGIDEQNSLSTDTNQNEHENVFVTRLSKILSIDDLKLLLENRNTHGKDNIHSKTLPNMRIIPSTTEQTKNLCDYDIQRMHVFFAKLSERESKTETKKEDAKRRSVTSIIENAISKSEQCGDHFQTAIQRVLLSDTLKNYKKNFKSFDMGVLKKNSDRFKNNTSKKYVKCKVTKEAFEFDASKMYGARSVRMESALFKFAAKALPRPPPMPLPAALKTSSQKAKKHNSESENKRRQCVTHAPMSRRMRRARRRLPPPAFNFAL